MKKTTPFLIALFLAPAAALAVAAANSTADTKYFELDHTVFPIGTTMVIERTGQGDPKFEAHVYKGTDTNGLHIWDVYGEAAWGQGHSNPIQTFFRNDRGGIVLVTRDRKGVALQSFDFTPNRCMRAASDCTYAFSETQGQRSGTTTVTAHKIVTKDHIMQHSDESTKIRKGRFSFVYKLDSCGMATDVDIYRYGNNIQTMRLIEYNLPDGTPFTECKEIDLSDYVTVSN